MAYVEGISLQLQDKVLGIVRDQLGTMDVHQHQTLMDDLGYDSLDIIELTVDLEKAFDIDIPEEFLATANEETTIGTVMFLLQDVLIAKHS